MGVATVKRRDLLRSVPGALVGATAVEGAPGDRSGGSRTPSGAPDRRGIDDCADDDGVSVRCLGRQLDPERPAKRLGGHRPPEFRDGGDPPRRLDFYTPVDGTPWDDRSGSALDRRRRRTVSRHARDAGMAHREDKGLFELHRFASDRDPASLRALTDRYESGDVFTLLFLNAALFEVAGFPTQYGDIDQRQREIGRMLRAKEYDVVGLNEVWFRRQIETLLGETGDVVWAGSPPGNDDDAPDNNGLLTVLLDNDDGPTPAYVGDDFGFYDRFGSTAGLDSLVRKGWHHTEIDLGPGNVDLFVTHLNHKWDDEKYRGIRLNQVEELITAVETHSKDENVTIVGGDFNVLGNRAGYDEVVRRLDDRLGLQDVWLTRGGQVARTSWFADHEYWRGSSTPDWPWYCADYDEGCVCDPYVDGVDGRTDDGIRIDANARLDYVFVESPTAAHDLRVDIKRVRRKLFPRTPSDVVGDGPEWRRTETCGTDTVDCLPGWTSCDTEPYLSDHMGLELEVLVNDA